MPESNRLIWLKTYTTQLQTLYGANPQWLARVPAHLQRPTVPETLRALAEKITGDLPLGKALKESAAIGGTCRSLGIEHTYQAIKTFLTAIPSPVPGAASTPPLSAPVRDEPPHRPRHSVIR